MSLLDRFMSALEGLVLLSLSALFSALVYGGSSMWFIPFAVFSLLITEICIRNAIGLSEDSAVIFLTFKLIAKVYNLILSLFLESNL